MTKNPYWFPGRRQQTTVELRKRALDEGPRPAVWQRWAQRLAQGLVGPFEAEVARLTAERDAAQDDAAREFERAESEYEVVDAIAKLLTEVGRPDEEGIVEGVQWLVAERARLLAVLRDVEWGANGQDFAVCPSCGVIEAHAPDCRLAATLEGRDA